MNRSTKLHFGLVVVGCALLLTLSVLSATAGATPMGGDTSTTADVGAETVASQQIERPPAVAAQTDEAGKDCVVDSFGFVYPELVEVRCGESESGEPSLAIGGSEGWAYVMYLDIPSGSNKTGILRRGGTVITRSDLNNPDFPLLTAARWTDELPIFDDEVAIVRQSSGKLVYSDAAPGDPFLFEHQPGSIFQSIPPGVYNIRVVVYEKTKVPNPGGDALAQAIRNAPRQESELTVELGDCEADYNAEQRLESVDQNILDTYEDLGEAKAKYSEARRSFGNNVRSLTDSILSGGTKAA